MLDVKILNPNDWRVLQKIRLAALGESPEMFLHTYEQEVTFDEAKWRSEFTRGDWFIGVPNGGPPDRPVTVLGVTREADTPGHQCYLEYLWVAPDFRRSGVAVTMMRHVLGHLLTGGVRTAFLYVLDGNDRAMRLYKRIGFTACNYIQPIAERPGRSEELMQIALG